MHGPWSRSATPPGTPGPEVSGALAGPSSPPPSGTHRWCRGTPRPRRPRSGPGGRLRRRGRPGSRAGPWRPGVLRVGRSRRGRPQRRAKSSKRKAAGREREAGEAEHAKAARQSRGMASRCAQPAGGHDPAWARRGSGSQAGGAANAGLGGASRTRRGGRSWAELLAAQAQWGHVALPVPAGGSQSRRSCPRPPDSPESRPARRTVHGLACHVTDSRRPPEVACVATTKIPGVENVTSLTDRGAEGGADF